MIYILIAGATHCEGMASASPDSAMAARSVCDRDDRIRGVMLT